MRRGLWWENTGSLCPAALAPAPLHKESGGDKKPRGGLGTYDGGYEEGRPAGSLVGAARFFPRRILTCKVLLQFGKPLPSPSALSLPFPRRLQALPGENPSVHQQPTAGCLSGICPCQELLMARQQAPQRNGPRKHQAPAEEAGFNPPLGNDLPAT